MKIGITYRLFLSILGATALAIFSLFFIMRWNIDHGFREYLKNLDQNRLEQMTRGLEDAYAEHGDWAFLRENPRLWIGALQSARTDETASSRAGRPEPDGRREGPPMPPRPGRQRWPFMVLDAERKPIFGRPEDMEGADFRPVMHDGKTVGYVGVVPPRQFLNQHQLRFLKQQTSELVLAAGGMVLAVMLFSLPLAKRLVRPIRAITVATGELASGKYDVRVPAGSGDELGQLARDFNTMALTLEKNEQARRQWVADISHELRTPVAILRAELEALLDGIRMITPETVQSLHAEVLRLNRLVEDLYQLSISDIGALTYRKEPLSLSEVLHGSLESHQQEFKKKNVALLEDIKDSEITVSGDFERLSQLFSNLLENSLRYTDPSGTLVVRLGREQQRAVIEFEDSAPGVPAAELSRLFDRLYRVESSRSRTSGGAGLGLAICKNIVEAHQGAITAEASELGGLLIRITFPLLTRSS